MANFIGYFTHKGIACVRHARCTLPGLPPRGEVPQRSIHFSRKNNLPRRGSTVRPNVTHTEEEQLEGTLELPEQVSSWTEAQHLKVHDNFLNSATQLREHFVHRFSKPRETRAERFVWDYWHIPGQYTLLRTPADQFFPPKLYQALEDQLVEFGERSLGCRALTPVWLSYYVDGCHQGLHADNLHGPWAFVLSLTDWEHKPFTGGETMVLQPQVLDYWRTFDSSKGTETPDLMQLVEPHFNRLTVFDPRFPHGVRMVEGTRDPIKARIVLHGWFTDPSPFFTGGLSEEEATPALNDVLDELYLELGQLPRGSGTVTVRLTISGQDGRVTQLDWLTDTLIPVPGEVDPTDARDAILSAIVEYLVGATFPVCANGNTEITLPFIFG